MQVALYLSHHHLPFWHNPEQPKVMFNPTEHASWKMEVRDDRHLDECRTILVQADTTWMWPILMGLHQIELLAMAHVSFGFSEGQIKPRGRGWVQVTTIPVTEVDGIPLVVDMVDGKPVVQVNRLWGFDNGTRTPWEFEWARTASEAEKMTPGFWTASFRREIFAASRGEMEKALRTIHQAQQTIALWLPIALAS